MAAAARRAARSVGATTPTKSPSRTIETPAMARARVSSIEASVAPMAFGRTTLPYSSPGRTTSGVY